MKLPWGSPASDGKTGVSYTGAIEFAGFAHGQTAQNDFRSKKDSLPQQALLFDDGGDETSPPPLEGEVDARSAAGGVTASKGSRAGGSAAHPTPRPFGPRPSPCRGG
jgi:hypothetical protein